jgi:signal transduction histidine kinase
MWKKLLTLYAIFAVSLAFLVMLSLYSFQRYNAYVNYADAIDHHHLLLTQLTKLNAQLEEVQNHQRGFLLYDDSVFLHRFAGTTETIKTSFAAIHALTQNNVEQQKRVFALNISIKSALDFLNTEISVGHSANNKEQEENLMEKCKRLVNEMEHAEKQALSERQIVKEFYENNTPRYFTLVFVFTLLIFCVSFGLLAGQYRSRVKYQQKLENKIIELNQANAESEQMSFIAAHDLQEPLRKIRTFSALLTDRHAAHLDDEAQTILKRIDAASVRVQSLMQDIVNYNTIAHTHEDISEVDLFHLINEITHDREHTLRQQNANVLFDDLPLLKGYASQLNILFRSLFDNSVKFAKPDITCTITITASVISKDHLPVKGRVAYTHYHKIIVADNGIGFENKFIEKIFQMFQRLHGQDSPYEGHGLGLALVKRIMTNHHGLVEGTSEPGKGATFILYFPVL